jgi:hypothetical protein
MDKVSLLLVQLIKKVLRQAAEALWSGSTPEHLVPWLQVNNIDGSDEPNTSCAFAARS